MAPNILAPFPDITRERVFWASLSGVLLTGVFPDFNITIAAPFCLVPLLVAVSGVGFKSGAAIGWIAGMVHHVSLLYWTAYTMHVYGNLPWVLSIPVLVVLCMFLSLYTAMFGGLLAWIGKREPGWMLLAAPVSWVALEYMKTHILTGFPWALLGYGLQPVPLLVQAADLAGVYGLSFLVVFLNAGIAQLLLHWRHRKSHGRKRSFMRDAAPVVLSLTAALAGCAGYGVWRLADVRGEMGRAPSLTVSVIQGNIDQGVKWDKKFLESTTRTYVDLSAAAAENKPDLIVWPETATPFYYGQQSKLSDLVDAAIQKTGTHFLIGSPSFKRNNSRFTYYNTAFLLDPDARILGAYNKVHLVPYGEYVPLKKYLPFIGKLVAQVGDFSAGQPGVVIALPEGTIGAQICYEIIFPGLTREMVQNGADLLVNLTNDAWFGRSGAPFQHFSMAAMRAVEYRRSLVRAANTGVSGFVLPTGAVAHATSLFERTAATQAVPLMRRLTVYARIGDAFALGCLLVTIILIAAIKRTPRS